MAYNQAIRVFPQYVEAWEKKGEALFALEMYSDALNAYGEACNLDQVSTGALLKKAITLNVLKKAEEANAVLDTVIAINPGNEIAWYQKGVALLELGNAGRISKLL